MKRGAAIVTLSPENRMENDLTFIKEAIRQAEIAAGKSEVPVGCVIELGGKIIARSHNQRVAKQSALAHAEIIAINRACKKLGRSFLDEATLYVTLEPCLMCTGAIFQARIKRVVYGAKEPKFGVLGSLMDLSKENRFNHRLEIISGLCEAEISAMMKEFFQKLREQPGTCENQRNLL